jgi:hypothetical protein
MVAATRFDASVAVIEKESALASRPLRLFLLCPSIAKK